MKKNKKRSARKKEDKSRKRKTRNEMKRCQGREKLTKREGLGKKRRGWTENIRRKIFF